MTMLLTRRLMTAFLAASLAVGACAAPDAAKPAADPDVATLESKADGISNWWTTIVGALEVGDSLKRDIDFPDWFHGHTLELEAGQTIEFSVTANADGYVRVYGPSHKTVNGSPRFKKAVVKSFAKAGPADTLAAAAFTVEVQESGTYMLVYGPRWVWSAQYKVKADCVGGCLPDDACGADGECLEENYCGHNGVVCFTTPCDVAYDICKPREAAGAWCDRDQVCQVGLFCNTAEGVCEAPIDDGTCDSNDDCSDGFCGCIDATCSSRICKPWQQEGQSCGGFTLPHFHTQCGPGLTCASPYWVADLPGVCAIQASPKALYDDPEAFDGHVVAVTGNILTGYAMCTKMACWEDNPCCNNCGASQKLYGAAEFPNGEAGMELVGADGASYGCGGNECTYLDQCTADDGEALVIGTFSYSSADSLTLDIQQIWEKPW